MTKRSKRVGTDDKMIYDDDDNRSRGGNVYFCRLWARGFRWSSSAFSPDACFGLATRRIFVFAFSTFFVSHRRWPLRGLVANEARSPGEVHLLRQKGTRRR